MLEAREQVKCVLVGDTAVGKSALLESYMHNEFMDKHRPTVVDEHFVNVRQEGGRHTLKQLNVWDTGGTEEADRLRTLSYANTQMFLICFSLDSPSSLQSVETRVTLPTCPPLY